jgi:hypothetical protein
MDNLIFAFSREVFLVGGISMMVVAPSRDLQPFLKGRLGGNAKMPDYGVWVK